MRNFNPKKFTGQVLKFMVAGAVLAFLGLHSLNFFMYVFPPEQWYYAFLGFGLTGGGAVAYLYIFVYEADTKYKAWVALVIGSISALGEILTAIFGMMVEAWYKSGWTLTESDFTLMLWAVGLLALAHASALAAYIAGPKIGALFADDDKDGVPNFADEDYWSDRQRKSNKGSNNTPRVPVNDSRTPQVAPVSQNQHKPRPGTSFTVSDLERVTGMSLGQIVGQYPDKKAFKSFAANQFDYIDADNLHRLWLSVGDANPTQAVTGNHRR